MHLLLQHATDPYRLQVRDRVVYFKEGHTDKKGQPHCFAELPLVAFCEVKNIKYAFPPKQVRRKRGDPEESDENQYVWCRYCVCIHVPAIIATGKYYHQRFPQSPHPHPPCLVLTCKMLNVLKPDMSMTSLHI